VFQTKTLFDGALKNCAVDAFRLVHDRYWQEYLVALDVAYSPEYIMFSLYIIY